MTLAAAHKPRTSKGMVCSYPRNYASKKSNLFSCLFVLKRSVTDIKT
jgi:hypothetical protein